MKYSRRLYSRSGSSKNLLLLIGIIFFGTFIFYGFLRPQDTGILGQEINNIFYKFSGVGRFFIPILIFYWVWYNLKSKKHNFKTVLFLSLVLFILASGIIKVGCNVLNLPGEYAGWLGNNVLEIFSRIFGVIFGSISIIIFFIYVSSLMFEISLSELFWKIYTTIVADIQNWYKEISVLRAKKKVEKEVEQSKKVSRYSNREQMSNTKLSEKEDILKKEQKQSFLTSERTKVEKQNFAITKNVSKQSIDKQNVKGQKVTFTVTKNNYVLPSLDLLSIEPSKNTQSVDLESRALLLENSLKEFEINAKVVNISTGPVVTMYELELEPGIKVQSVLALRDNISMAMRSDSVRIIAPLADRGTIGIEIPNPKSRIVKIREIFDSEEYKNCVANMKLPIALGKTVDGKPYVSDIVPMPHLLIAGATGSGKSVGVHSIIISLLYKCSPDKLKFLMIDPKRLELTVYNGIPHIYDPYKEPSNAQVITSSREAAKSLSGLVKVMEQRYEKFAKVGVRNIEGYNELMKSKNEQEEFYIVVVIDEFADLILTVPKEVEDSIQRLAQMARAVGIHLILATQRPSVDVITGVIKANFSARIAFQVLSKTDSRVNLRAGTGGRQHRQRHRRWRDCWTDRHSC
ncbi:MAG: DNA translocase FtsK 4TM domain-containing protein, partial [Endomicrobiia bacterium]